MARKKTSPLMDDSSSEDNNNEYQYSDEEMSTEEYASESLAPKKSIFSFFRSKKLWVAIAVVIAIVVIAKIMQSRSNINEVVAPTVPSEQAVEFKPEVSTGDKVQIQPEVQASQEVTRQVNELKRQNMVEDSQLQKLQTTVSGMKGDIVRQERAVNNLNDSVQTLIQQGAQPTCKIGQQQTVKKVVAKSPVPKKRYVRPLSFVIKAMMPGRAWLQANNGKALTVKVGDQLKGYGVVQLVDVNRGIVLTSSGRIIRYGRDDQ